MAEAGVKQMLAESDLLHYVKAAKGLETNEDTNRTEQ